MATGIGVTPFSSILQSIMYVFITCIHESWIPEFYILAFSNLFQFLNENPFTTDQSKRQNSWNKIKGTPILKLAMVERLKVNKNLTKKIVKKIVEKFVTKNSSKKFVKADGKLKKFRFRRFRIGENMWWTRNRYRYHSARRECPRCNLRWLTDLGDAMQNLKKVDFIWINRDQKSFEWFLNLLTRIEADQQVDEEYSCNNHTGQFLLEHLFVVVYGNENWKFLKARPFEFCGIMFLSCF